ncbi:hypothetical protein SAMN05444354_110257 [Stigmatella aurantiaca]|uniref:Uncharacterized protein n=1 Tax=Stigmatella aurantiaca TaxID=41 RepID=A0A1H7UYQ0_STIAU|nr:hypothetical protein [Stigmatella aurantiaca]SEM02070.1 hypothetical protein SAMN05444354_110257 [Stigmatella aurantiaca]
MSPPSPVPFSRAVVTALFCLVLALPSHAQAPTPKPAPAAGDMLLLTIFLRHDQGKTVDEINAHLERTGFRKSFPPEGVEVVSWYVMMGVGQVVTLRLPPSKLRAVNLAIEKGAWGGFRTEFYPTYDYRPIWEEMRAKTR